MSASISSVRQSIKKRYFGDSHNVKSERVKSPNGGSNVSSPKKR